MNPCEAIGVVFGAVSVWLTVRESIWCWPTGLVSVALFSVVFWEAKLYADMGLQVVYVLLSVYGWYEWLHGGEDRGELRVSRTPKPALATLLVLGTAGLFGLGFTLKGTTDASLPFWDSATTSFSLVAQWMLTRKWIENWAIWIAVDVIYVGMYVYKQLYLTAGLYVVFLVLASLGLLAWKKTLGAAVPA